MRANAGAAGIDGQTISDFEFNLKDNLYKLWNRLSSGSYHPPAVKGVAIPKKSGGERLLGIPTVADRVAQTVVRNRFEPLVEPHFLPDSYGYRPHKSALDAVAITRRRCWKYDWVIPRQLPCPVVLTHLKIKLPETLRPLLPDDLGTAIFLGSSVNAFFLPDSSVPFAIEQFVSAKSEFVPLSIHLGIFP